MRQAVKYEFSYSLALIFAFFYIEGGMVKDLTLSLYFRLSLNIKKEMDE